MLEALRNMTVHTQEEDICKQYFTYIRSRDLCGV